MAAIVALPSHLAVFFYNNLANWRGGATAAAKVGQDRGRRECILGEASGIFLQFS